MMITFGQYNTLVATRQRLTHDQLTQQTEFTELMVNYFVAGLLANGLVTLLDDETVARYELTESGLDCIIEYERQNPELTVTRALRSNFFE